MVWNKTGRSYTWSCFCGAKNFSTCACHVLIDADEPMPQNVAADNTRLEIAQPLVTDIAEAAFRWLESPMDTQTFAAEQRLNAYAKTFGYVLPDVEIDPARIAQDLRNKASETMTAFTPDAIAARIFEKIIKHYELKAATSDEEGAK